MLLMIKFLDNSHFRVLLKLREIFHTDSLHKTDVFADKNYLPLSLSNNNSTTITMLADAEKQD